MAYAENTCVSVEKSRAEIETTLRRYGADGFRYGWLDREGRRVEQIEFTAKGKLVRFTLALPSKDDKQFLRSPAGRVWRDQAGRYKAWEQSCRQRWRALALCIKAKLEAVQAGITHFEHEFLAQMVDGETGKTVAELMKPWIEGRLSATQIIGLPSPEQAYQEQQ